jgi:2-methylcitrate dehydratase PrpD
VGSTRLTQRIVDFAADLRFSDIPPDVVAKAKLHILDTVGCGLAGAPTALSRQILAYLRIEHGPGACPVLGSDYAFGPAAAAFGNAAAMNALDFDDGFEIDGKGMGHPGASLVAAALSAAFTRKTSGADFLTAIVTAYEINSRLIHAMQPTLQRFRQVYGVCQHQTIGAAVAFGKLAGLDARALENALGLAGILANVPSLRKYNWEERPLLTLKDLNAPAAEAGVRAVQLHQCGVIGAKSVLDGDGGLWRMLGSDRFDGALLVDGIGSEWRLLCASFKPYPACRWMHTALEAFETLLQSHGLGPVDIDAITVHTSAGMARDLMDHAPQTMVDAQFSLPFGLAALAYVIRPFARWYDADTLVRDDLRALSRRVHALVDPTIDHLMSAETRRPAGQVSVRTGDRIIASELITYPRGGAERPMPASEITFKFLENAILTLGRQRAQTLSRRLEELESEADVSRVFRFEEIEDFT